MTQRQMAEARVINSQLKPSENADAVSCIGPASLIFEFQNYLQEHSITSEIVSNALESGIADVVKFSEIRFEVPLATAKGVVQDFAVHLASQSEEDIPGYWGGSLPDETVDSLLEL